MNDLPLVLKGAGITFIGFFASKLFGYFFSIILARTLTPSEIGVLAVAGGVLGFVIMFANLGIPHGVLRYIPFYQSKGKEASVKGTLLGAIGLNAVSSIIFAVVLFFVSDYIGVGIYNNPVLANVLKVFAFVVPFATISSLLMLAIQGFKQIKYRVIVRNVAENISKILTYLTLFLLGFRVMAAAFSFLVSYMVAIILALFFIEKRVFPFLRSKIKPEFHLKTLMNFSWPLLAATFFALLLTTIDFFMLGYFVDTAAVGIYSMAETLSRTQLIVNESLAMLFLPIVTGYFAQGKKEDMAKFFKIITRWIFLFSIPIFVFIAIFSVQLLQAFYGEQYVAGFAALAILALGFFFVGAVGPTQHMINAIGRPRFELLNTIIAAIANVILNWVLIPIYGLTGAAIATATSYILWNVLSLVEVYLLMNIHPYSKGYLPPLAAITITSVLFYLASPTILTPTISSFPLNILVLAAFSGTFYFVYLLFFVIFGGIGSEDLEMLRKIEGKAGFKISFVRNFVKRFS